jgi:hypothetical protein
MRYLVALASFLAILAVGCDGNTSVMGQVVDPEKKPIDSATVKFTQRPDDPGAGRIYETTTDDDGRFNVGITHAPTKTMPFLLEVSKEGYVRHEERLRGSARYEKEIILQPLKK